MWLNLVTSTKLPTYREEGSSHHVFQQIFFFYDFFFWWSFFFIFLMISFFDDFFFFLLFFFNSFFFFFVLLTFFLFFSAWLNSAKDTKLPTYPRKGSSHHVVQKIFFFFDNLFFFLCIFAKRKAQCVIVGITTDRTRDGLKGDVGIQPLRHTSNWWHTVGLISPYWYAFKGNGKTSCTLTVLQWVV